jgi:sulfide dehydrogenase cytochrome subunit
VASHFAKLPFVAAKQSFDAQKAAAGEKLHARDCAKCHTKGGRDAADDASLLGGQHLKYLQQALADFKKGEREQSKKMAEKLGKWSEADIEAVAHYYASLQ